MKLAVISDIHGNWPAFRAVLKDLEEVRVSQILCLGDVIGYNADSWLCWQKLKELSVPVKIIKGNHENALNDPLALMNFSRKATAGIELAQRQISSIGDGDKILEEVGQLPLTAKLEKWEIALAHGDFINPALWYYVFGSEEAQEQFNALPASLNFVGHTHQPFVYEYSGRRMIYGADMPNRLVIFPDKKYLINPGSVGQPRDRDPRASYGILHLTGKNRYFILKRVTYDIDEAASLIRAAGLPPASASRLYRGE